MLLDVFLGDETDATFPAGRWVVENVKDLEFLFVDVCEFLKVVLEEDIFRVDISVNEGDGGTIKGVPESGADDLNHGRDSGASCDHAEVFNNIRGIEEIALGPFDTDGLSNFEKRDVFGDVTLLISLELEMR